MNVNRIGSVLSVTMLADTYLVFIIVLIGSFISSTGALIIPTEHIRVVLIESQSDLGESFIERKAIFDDIRDGVSVEDTSYQWYTRTISLSGRTNKDMLVNDPTTSVSKTEGLYCALSCIAGEWTLIHVDDFLRSFPLFYDSDFRKTDYDNAFVKYRDEFTTGLNAITDQLAVFVTIIHDVLHYNRISLYHKDSFILKSLVALKTKCALILSGELSPVADSDEVMIREMLREILAVRSFLLMKCGTISPDYKHVGSEELERLKSSINSDVNAVEDVFSKALRDPRKCNDFDRPVLLENVIVEDVFNASVRIADNTWTTVGELLRKIPRLAYDVETMHWYGRSVVPAILKLIVCKILTLTPGDGLTHEIVAKIWDIYSVKISDNPELYPPQFVECFGFLSRLVRVRNDFETDEDYFQMQLRVVRRYREIDNVELSKCPAKILIENRDQLDAYYNGGYATTEDAKRLSVQNAREELRNLLGKIATHLDDFRCFHEYFKSLHLDLDKTYNARSAGEVQRKLDWDDKCAASSIICKFALDMYVACHKTIMFLNRAIEEKKGHLERVDWFFRAWRSIEYIRNHFLAAIKSTSYDSENFFPVAVDIAIVLWQQQEPKDDGAYGQYLKRILYFVMAKINEYGIGRCTLYHSNYFWFDNVNFNLSKNHSVVAANPDVERDRYFPNRSADSVQIPHPKDDECLTAKFLSQKFFNRFSDFAKNQSFNTKVHWEGKPNRMRLIFEDTNFLHLDPHYLRVLYDLYFKFYLAIIYHEIKKVHRFLRPDQRPPPDASAGSKVLDWHRHFPKKFRPLIDDINVLVKDLKYNTRFDLVENKIQRIEKQLEIFEISYKPRTTSTDSLMDVYENFNTNIGIIMDDVRVNVSAVSACYAIITRQESEHCDVKSRESPENEKKKKSANLFGKMLGKFSKEKMENN